MAVARSLGDHGMKEYVIGRPFVNTTIIDLDDTAFSNYIGGNGHGNDLPSSECFNSEFIIVACDGIWDVMDDQEAVNMVRKYVKQGSIKDGDVKKYKDTAARMLCKQALERGSTDNVTVLVVWF
jgi:serine/threonine protein phosphatase PrpC